VKKKGLNPHPSPRAFMLIPRVWWRDHGTPGQSGISLPNLTVQNRVCVSPAGCRLFTPPSLPTSQTRNSNQNCRCGRRICVMICGQIHPDYFHMLFRRPPMLMRLTVEAKVEADTAITRKSERRINDGHTSTSNPHHPLSLSSSFTFRRGHEQLTRAAAHRPHRQCCSWEMWMCAVLYTPPLRSSRPSFIGPYCS
jgi:hypothetical protein